MFDRGAWRWSEMPSPPLYQFAQQQIAMRKSTKGSNDIMMFLSMVQKILQLFLPGQWSTLEQPSKQFNG